MNSYRKKRLRRVATPGWTGVLCTIIWERIQLPCVIRWKVANVRTQDILCRGSCKISGCKAKIECIATKEKLTFVIEKFDSAVFHDPKIKRRLQPADKKKYEEMLISNSAYSVRNKQANLLMNKNGIEPLILPSAN